MLSEAANKIVLYSHLETTYEQQKILFRLVTLWLKNLPPQCKSYQSTYLNHVEGY